MSDSTKDTVWQACEALAKEKSLITIKNIKIKLYSLGYSNQELDKIEYDITSVINQWRIKKLNNSCNNITNDVATKEHEFNIYKALAIPRKEDKTIVSNLQKKVFTLEYELNQYKHTVCRVNKKNKLLEKKLHTTINNVQRERQEVITKLKGMLTK